MPNISSKSYYFYFRFVIFTCRYFKLSWNTTTPSQSNCRNPARARLIIGNFFTGVEETVELAGKLLRIRRSWSSAIDASLWLGTKILLVAQSQYPLSQIPLPFSLPSNPLPISTPATQAGLWNLSPPFFRTRLTAPGSPRMGCSRKRRKFIYMLYSKIFQSVSIQQWKGVLPFLGATFKYSG